MKKGLDISHWTRAQLLRLPDRAWNNAKPEYTSLLIFSTGKKHESGWACMTIIGCVGRTPVEVITRQSDDIEWKLPDAKVYYSSNGRRKFSVAQMRTDCVVKSRALHFWTQKGVFKVGHALSSITVELIYKKGAMK